MHLQPIKFFLKKYLHTDAVKRCISFESFTTPANLVRSALDKCGMESFVKRLGAAVPK